MKPTFLHSKIRMSIMVEFLNSTQTGRYAVIFDRATATAAMSKGSITTATIRPAADQKFLWILEFSCNDGRRERMTRARKSIVKTYKTCDASLG